MSRAVIRTSVVALCGLSLLAGCGRDRSAGELRTHLESEFQARYIQPYVAGDIDAWMNVFADDVVALHDGLPPLDGRDAVRGFGDIVTQNFAITRMDAVIDEVRRNGDWSWTRGQFIAVFEAKTEEAPPGIAGERSGKFLLIWERQDDGEWLVIMDMGNSMRSPGPE